MSNGSYCCFCGDEAPASDPWPRTCLSCGGVSSRGAILRVLVLIPSARGVHCVDRTLPRTYLGFGETWRQACARLANEAGLTVSPGVFERLDVMTDDDGLSTIVALGPTTPGEGVVMSTLGEEDRRICKLAGIRRR